jgi:hypothetical protein
MGTPLENTFGDAASELAEPRIRSLSERLFKLFTPAVVLGSLFYYSHFIMLGIKIVR